MDIEGFGEKLARQLTAAGLVTSPADIYRLTYDDLLTLPGFGQKKADNLLQAIEASRSRPLARLIFALGIRFVGKTMAELLVSKFDSMDAIQQTSEDILVSIEGIGPETATSIRQWFDIPANRVLLEELQRLGVNVRRLPEEESAEIDVESPIAGKAFVLTGSLPNLARQEAANLIERYGGRITESVSRRTDYVVVGEDAGAKLERAKELNVRLLGEDELLALLEERR